MLRLSSGALTLLLLATSAQAQVSAPMPAMPAMPGAPTAAATTPAPAPAQQPVALPEVSVPSVAAPASMPAIEAAPAPQDAATAAPSVSQSVPEAPPAAPVTEEPAPTIMVDPNDEFSYGTSGVSLLFTTRQIERMKSVLSVYETARRNRVDTPITVVEEKLGEEVKPISVDEPAVYPVFTLKSIAYRAANDWTVWIGDLRITPRNNEQEIRVLAVSPNRAQFLWKPAYAEALQQRDTLKQFAPTDTVKHKMTRANTAVYDRAAGQVTFTLLPNQSFAPAYMATFEGKIASPALPKLVDDTEVPETAGAPVPAASAPADNTSAGTLENLDALLRSQQKSGPVGRLFRQSLGGNRPNPQSAPPTN